MMHQVYDQLESLCDFCQKPIDADEPYWWAQGYSDVVMHRNPCWRDDVEPPPKIKDSISAYNYQRARK